MATDEDYIDELLSARPEEKPSARLWLNKIEEAEKDEKMKRWQEQCRNADKLYSREDRADKADREYAIFWANIETLKPAVYARPPVPVVVPRFKDSNPVASKASDVLERCLITSFEQGDVDGMMREVRDEFLRYGRGTCWARLGKNRKETPEVVFDHVTADDFIHPQARTWREVPWVARGAYLTREEGVARFGPDFDGVPLSRKDPDSAAVDKEDKARVYEIWDKAGWKVIWVAKDHADILDEKEPFLDLTGFFPCPRPAYATLIPKKLTPVPDIAQYKDQLEEINDYTRRIAALSEFLRMKGFYPSGVKDLSEAIEVALASSDDRALLVPIASLAGLSGISLKDAIAWLPVDQVAALVKVLVELRRVVIEDVYQITGISDIVRGQTEASETLGAQQLKSQWGSLRIRERQNELARMARDLTRIAGEIIAENFDPQTMLAMSQVQMPEEVAAQVFAFLRDDRARGFVIEIETDSTIQPDEDAEKQRRVEFVTAVGGLFQQTAPMVMQAPQLGPFLCEVLKFAASGFRAGRPLEGAIEKLTQMLEQSAQQAMQPKEPPPPSPEEQIKLETAKVKGHADTVKAQASVQTTQMDLQRSTIEHRQSIEQMAAAQALAQAQPNGAAQ